MRVERPFAYCCAEGGGRVEACDCVNKDHGTAWSDAPRNSVNALLVPRDVLARIRTSMCMLQQNSEGCATNHYGGDHELFGVPGWLADTRRDVDALTAILALTPVEGVGVSEERSKFRTIGENWSTAGRLEVPLAMGPRLSDAAKERLRKLEELDAVALIEACKYPMGSRFTYHDEEGEHDPAYVVIPGGEMVPINGYDDGDAPIPTDVARAAFIVTACNVALSTPVAQGDEVRGFVRDFRSRANQCRTNNVAHCPEAASVWDLAADALEGKS